MKFIYEHDEEEDFIEIQLSPRDLELIAQDKMIEQNHPSLIHSKRATNILIRRQIDAINKEQEQESNRKEHRSGRSSGQAKKTGSSHSA
jgi:hypothetical protein